MNAEPTTTNVERELARQPECWRQAVAAADEFTDVLPRSGERVAIVGCGTSLYMSRAYAARREALGHGVSDAFAASEYPHERRYDRVIGITRSGTTTELIEVLGATAAHTPTTVLTVSADAPAVVAGSSVITLPYAAEESVVQTVFPTSVLALLRAALGDDLSAAIAAAEEAVEAPLPLAAAELNQVTFLGRGWAAGIADEAALKCREAAGFWTESYPSMEYRHGPISVSGPGTAVWAFGDVPAGLEADATATGATFVHRDVDAMADLIRAQRLAVALAKHAGRDPDHPQALSFSIVLDDR